jgi:hypothetical protein
VIVSDVRQQVQIPDAAVRRVDPSAEVPSLEREILALAGNPELRRQLGAAAAEHVRVAHAPEAVLERWEEALEATRKAPLPAPRDWPPHWPRP